MVCLEFFATEKKRVAPKQTVEFDTGLIFSYSEISEVACYDYYDFDGDVAFSIKMEENGDGWQRAFLCIHNYGDEEVVIEKDKENPLAVLEIN